MKTLALLLAFAAFAIPAQAVNVDLSWTDNANNEQGFTVERSSDEVQWFVVGETTTDVTTFRDAQTVVGASYAYRVRAFNAAGVSNYSPWARVTIPASGIGPAAPDGLSVTIPQVGRLTNISSRGLVSVEAGVVIGGFTVAGAPLKVLIRAIGPGLTQFGVANVLANPLLELVGGASNDDWSGSDIVEAAQAVSAFPLVAGSKDAALLVTLDPGSYTFHVSGVGGVTGIALAEVYEVRQ